MFVTYRKVGRRWHIRFIKGSGSQRREVIKSLPGSLHKKSVKKKAAWYEMEWSMGRLDPFEEKRQEGTTLLIDAVDEYCEENLASGNWAEKSTYRVTKNVFKRMFAGAEGAALGEQTDQAFFQRQFNGSAGNARTRKGNAGRLNSFLRWAHDNGYLPERYTVSISKHEEIELRNTEKTKYLTWQQLRDICCAHRWLRRQNERIWKNPSPKPDDFYTDTWWFYFYSLLRAEELSALKAGDLLAGGRLRVKGKGRRTDTIYLPPPALTIAEKFAMGKDKSEALFVSSTNRSRKHFERAVRLAMGEQFASGDGRTGFHQLRHGGVVHYLSLGKPIQFISKLARHRSIRITDETYGDIINEAQRNAFMDVQHRPANADDKTGQDIRFIEMN